MLAALIALAVILFVDNPGQQAPEVFSDGADATIDSPTKSAAPVVATLTAEHNAVWQGVAGETMPHVGDPLVVGRRLILAEWIAQITTRRGAIAILKAPATIELLDSDNALRLVTGKLVGICETPSSKGFLVRTPHMDVTDLGTRFGVDATNADTTQVHVLQGEIEVARPSLTGDAPTKEILTQGQGLIAYAGRDDLQPVTVEPARFASIMPRRIVLMGTGQGLSAGDSDPNWRVIAVNGQRLETPAFLKVGDKSGGTAGRPANGPETSQWLLGDHIDIERTKKEMLITCQASFELPADVDPKSARLVMRFDADERVDEVRINGRAITPAPHSFTDDQVELNTLIIPGPLATGANTLELDIIDLVRNRGPNWGMRVQIELEDMNRSAP